MPETERLSCEFCKNIIREDDEYCVSCGHLFEDDVLCNNHDDADAEGVCVICSYAFCKECGKFDNGIFFCTEHKGYQVFQSMACVFGSNDNLEAEYIKNALAAEGMHPFLFDKKLSITGTDYSWFNTSADPGGHVLNEIKIMVPLNETLEAVELIATLKSSEDGAEEEE